MDENEKARILNEFKARNGLTESQLEKLKEIVTSGNVKRHVFGNGKREIWTVVGSNGDMLILPTRRYCSCRDYYFRVLSNKTAKCYHLLAKDLSEELASYETVEISEEEYPQFAALILQDVVNATET